MYTQHNNSGMFAALGFIIWKNKM